MEIELTNGVTVDEGVVDGEICINVMPQWSDETHLYLTKEHINKLLAMFDE